MQKRVHQMMQERKISKMNYKEFTEYTAATIKDYLPETYDTAKVSLRPVVKNNDITLVGLQVLRSGSNIAPNIYLEYYYNRYEEGMSLVTIMDSLAKEVVDHEQENMDLSVIEEFDQVKEKVFPRLINAAANENYLSDKPHETIEDLAVVYEIMLSEIEDGSAGIIFTNNMMENYNISVQELHEQAMRNLRVSNDMEVTNMEAIIRNMIMQSGMDIDTDIERIFDDQHTNMFVVTNKKKVYGAVVILDPDFMDKVADTLGGDFYVLPSSVHECICIPKTDDSDYHELEDMVREVNATQVSDAEKLSDYVYEYIAGNHMLRRCNRDGMLSVSLDEFANRRKQELAAKENEINNTQQIAQNRIRHGR